jgi:hypothetical protein
LSFSCFFAEAIEEGERVAGGAEGVEAAEGAVELAIEGGLAAGDDVEGAAVGDRHGRRIAGRDRGFGAGDAAEEPDEDGDAAREIGLSGATRAERGGDGVAEVMPPPSRASSPATRARL